MLTTVLKEKACTHLAIVKLHTLNKTMKRGICVMVFIQSFVAGANVSYGLRVSWSGPWCAARLSHQRPRNERLMSTKVKGTDLQTSQKPATRMCIIWSLDGSHSLPSSCRVRPWCSKRMRWSSEYVSYSHRRSFLQATLLPTQEHAMIGFIM